MVTSNASDVAKINARISPSRQVIARDTPGQDLSIPKETINMGAIWKFFSGEDDTSPATEQSTQRTSIWGLMTGQHAPETFPEQTASAYH